MSEWADETIIRLRSLWDEGHSTAEIGRRLGVTKNAVVGKAHRFDLPARPSPIRRECDVGFTRVARAPRAPRATKVTLAPLASTAAAPAPLPPPSLRRQGQPGAIRPTPAARASDTPRLVIAATRAAPSRPQPPRRRDGSGCVFPIGEPGVRSGSNAFHYCDADLDPAGSPYCCAHHKLCHVKIRDLRVAERAIAA